MFEISFLRLIVFIYVFLTRHVSSNRPKVSVAPTVGWYRYHFICNDGREKKKKEGTCRGRRRDRQLVDKPKYRKSISQIRVLVLSGFSWHPWTLGKTASGGRGCGLGGKDSRELEVLLPGETLAVQKGAFTSGCIPRSVLDSTEAYIMSYGNRNWILSAGRSSCLQELETGEEQLFALNVILAVGLVVMDSPSFVRLLIGSFVCLFFLSCFAR